MLKQEFGIRNQAKGGVMMIRFYFFTTKSTKHAKKKIGIGWISKDTHLDPKDLR